MKSDLISSDSGQIVDIERLSDTFLISWEFCSYTYMISIDKKYNDQIITDIKYKYSDRWLTHIEWYYIINKMFRNEKLKRIIK